MLDIEPETQKGETHCGAACLSMLCRYFGVAVSQDDVWTRLSVVRPSNPAEKFINTHAMALDMLEHGLNVIGFRAKDVVASLRDCSALEIPAIVPGSRARSQKYRQIGHFRVFLGSDTRGLHFNDPLIPTTQSLSVSAVSDICSRKNGEITGNWIVAVGKATLTVTTCDACKMPMPVAVRCQNCGFEIPLRLSRLLGCFSSSCPKRTWEHILCPKCDTACSMFGA